MTPSPHTAEHVMGVLGVPSPHKYPGIDPEQSSLHPFPSMSPSSHPSPNIFMLSPQIEVHVETSGVPEIEVHDHPVSIEQEELQPSPSIKFPSSHCSSPLIFPSLQSVVQTSTVVGVPPVHT